MQTSPRAQGVKQSNVYRSYAVHSWLDVTEAGDKPLKISSGGPSP